MPLFALQIKKILDGSNSKKFNIFMNIWKE